MKSKPLLYLLLLIVSTAIGLYSSTVYFVSNIERKVITDTDSTLSLSEKLAEYTSLSHLFGKSYYDYKGSDSNGLKAGEMVVRYKFKPLGGDSSLTKVNEANGILKYRIFNYLDSVYVVPKETEKGIFTFRLNSVTSCDEIRKLLTTIGGFSIYERVGKNHDNSYFVDVEEKIEPFAPQSIVQSKDGDFMTDVYCIRFSERATIDSLLKHAETAFNVSPPFRLIFGLPFFDVLEKNYYPLYLCRGYDDLGRGISMERYVVDATAQRIQNSRLNQIIIKTVNNELLRKEIISTLNIGSKVIAVIDNCAYPSLSMGNTPKDKHITLTGSFDYSTAKVLAAVIRSNPLPLEVEILSADYIPIEVNKSNLYFRYIGSIIGLLLSGCMIIIMLIRLFPYITSFLPHQSVLYEKRELSSSPQWKAMFWLMQSLSILALSGVYLFMFLSGEDNTLGLNIMMLLLALLSAIGIVLFFFREKLGWYFTFLLFILFGLGCMWHISEMDKLLFPASKLTHVVLLYLGVLYTIHALIILLDKGLLSLFGMRAANHGDLRQDQIDPKTMLFKRMIEYFIDRAVLTGIAVALFLIGDFHPLLKSDIWILIALDYLYFFISEYTTGRTIGKWILTLKVVSIYEGEKPSGKQIALRTFVRLIPFDYISFLFDWRWHDRVSGTTVIDTRKELE